MQRAQRPGDHSDDQIALQLERIIHRVKQSMNYRGSYTTRDILGSLVARWVRSGEWDRLKQLPPEQRHLGESVRRFILDRFDQLRRRGTREDLDPNSCRVARRARCSPRWSSSPSFVSGSRRGCTDLEAARVDDRVRIPSYSTRSRSAGSCSCTCGQEPATDRRRARNLARAW